MPEVLFAAALLGFVVKVVASSATDAGQRADQRMETAHEQRLQQK